MSNGSTATRKATAAAARRSAGKRTNGNGRAAEGVVVDLDESRRARAEARGANPTVVLGGETYELTPEMPLSAAEDMARGRISAALAQLLADSEQVDDFLANGVTNEDLQALFEGVYGVDLGEAPAS